MDNNLLDDESLNDSASSFASAHDAPLDTDDTGGRQLAWVFLGLAAIVCGLLFAGAFFFFQPDAKSLRDRYFPSPTATAIPTITPTRTATPTPTRSPTPTPSLTPTITPTPHALITPSHGETIFIETFENNDSEWEPFYSNSSAIVKDGKLMIRSTSKGYIGLVLCETCPNLHDAFYFQAEIFTVKETSQRYGLAICSPGQGSNYYVFFIDANRRYFSVDRHTSDWNELTNKYSAVINPHPVTNTLAVLFDQGTMNFYINNTLVFEYTDERPFNCRKSGFIVNEGLVDVSVDNIFAYNITLSPTPAP